MNRSNLNISVIHLHSLAVHASIFLSQHASSLASLLDYDIISSVEQQRMQAGKAFCSSYLLSQSPLLRNVDFGMPSKMCSSLYPASISSPSSAATTASTVQDYSGFINQSHHRHVPPLQLVDRTTDDHIVVTWIRLFAIRFYSRSFFRWQVMGWSAVAVVAIVGVIS